MNYRYAEVRGNEILRVINSETELGLNDTIRPIVHCDPECDGRYETVVGKVKYILEGGVIYENYEKRWNDIHLIKDVRMGEAQDIAHRRLMNFEFGEHVYKMSIKQQAVIALALGIMNLDGELPRNFMLEIAGGGLMPFTELDFPLFVRRATEYVIAIDVLLNECNTAIHSFTNESDLVAYDLEKGFEDVRSHWN